MISLRSTFSIDGQEHRHAALLLVKWLILGALVGVLAGIAAWVFLTGLRMVTDVRATHPWLILLLPLAGLLVGTLYYRYAGIAARGNNLIVEQLHTLDQPIPARMTPMILIATWIGHLAGASIGREGVGVQMSTALADTLFRALRLPPADRLYMLLAGIAGGFGAIFGTPLAGFVFALEVRYMGSVAYDAIVPCLTAAIVGDLTIKALGIHEAAQPQLPPLDLDPLLLIKVALMGIAFGLTAVLFIELTHAIKHIMQHRVPYAPLRPVIGGIALIGLTVLVGDQRYSGTGSQLAILALSGAAILPFTFGLKLIFTALSVGTGFVGGEVTPLFVMGATLGAVLGRLLGLDPVAAASFGFVAVFAAASNTPITCTLLGVELFGGGAALYVAVACFVAYLASGHRGIYATQRVGYAKVPGLDAPDDTLELIASRRLTKKPLP